VRHTMKQGYSNVKFRILALLLVVPLLATACDIGFGSGQDTPQNLPGNDWPTYLYNAQRTGVNPETILTPSNINQLTKLWSFKTQGVVAAPASVVGGTIYIGSWDGYEYALDSQIGALEWKTYLGRTIANAYCSPPQAGISSGAAIVNGTLYVGGGDAYWYALDAQSGNILWKVFVGDNSAKAGYYNWSSPLIYKGYAYIGAGSLGDCPLAPGKLMQVNLSTHKVKTLALVPPGQIGGGIWSSPAVDPATNTIYVATATENAITQTYAQAILAVDATTMRIKDHWKIPASQAVIDSDFGTTPAFFTDSKGTPMVEATNKNGIAYAFKRNDLKAGPVWKQYIAVGGDCPLCGVGSISTGAFAEGKLYLAGEDTMINGYGYQGSVRALDPTTGKVLWRHKSTGPIIGAITYSNGMIFDTAGNVLEVLSAKDGSRLASYTLDDQIFDAPTISHGQVIIGDIDGNVYDFGLPSATSRVASTSARCSENLTCWDIGRPATQGIDTASGESWSVTAGGNGMGSTIDQLHFVERSVSSDTQISVEVTSLQGSNPLAQAGIMLRQSSDPGSPNYTVFVTRKHNVVVQYRQLSNAYTVSAAPPRMVVPLPVYLRIQRIDDRYQAATSTDGIHYTLVPGSTVTLAMPTTLMGGLATGAGNDETTSIATYSNMAVGSPTTKPADPPPTTPCPHGWNCGSIGNPEIIGSQSFVGRTWTLHGSGVDIGAYADQFQFVWQQIPQDGQISARIVAQDSIDPWAKAGLMIRQSTDAGAPYYGALLTPGNGLVVQSRTDPGLDTTSYTVPAPNPVPTPFYLKIARSGNTFSTYMSTDGVTWNYVLGTSVNLDLRGPMLVGLAVSSHNGGRLGGARFDSVNVGLQAPPAPTACPDGWVCDDVGFAMLGGTQVYDTGKWTLQGGGADIANTADQFHGVWQVLDGNGSVSARVIAVVHTDTYAKAGVMLRQSEEPGSPYYAVFATPDNGFIVQYRQSQGDISVLNNFPAVTKLPIYLKVAHVGNDFSAYYSEDGIDWTIIPNETRTLNMPTTLFAGLAMTSHSSLQLGTATFDSVNIIGAIG
jgi:outer membrane protein assembly factor BamB